MQYASLSTALFLTETYFSSHLSNLISNLVHCGAGSVEKDKYLTHAHSSKLSGYHIVPNIEDTYQTYVQ